VGSIEGDSYMSMIWDNKKSVLRMNANYTLPTASPKEYKERSRMMSDPSTKNIHILHI
jgi:hypothetical protein